MLWDLLAADSTHDEDRCRLSGTDDETDQFDGLGVTPLQIVDDQQTRAVAATMARPTASNNRWR